MAWTKAGIGSIIGPNGGKMEPRTFSEVVANDIDKTLDGIIDCGGSFFEILGIRLEWAATATAGTREPTFEIKDADGDVLWSMHLATGADIIANGNEVIELSPNESVFTAAVDGGPHRDSIPRLILGQAEQLRIYDREAVDTADDIVVHVRGLLQ